MTEFAHLFVFAGSNKAGMESSDKERQAKVIYEMSKESKYFKHAKDSDEKLDRKIDKMKQKFSHVSLLQLQSKQKEVLKEKNEIDDILRSTSCMSCPLRVVIDMVCTQPYVYSFFMVIPFFMSPRICFLQPLRFEISPT